MEIINVNNVIIVFSEIIRDESILYDCVRNEKLMERLCQIKNNKRRLEILNSHFIINKLFGKNYTYEYDEQNKPFIKDIGKISITHTDNYISLIFGFEKKVGIDMEENDRDFTKAAQKFLHISEKKWAFINDYFKAIWCAKESCFKMIDNPEYSFSKYYITREFDFLKDKNIYVEVLEPVNKVVTLSFLKAQKFFLIWCIE